MTISKAIGIDLGTTYSCVAGWSRTHTEVFANDEGGRTTPSWVAFNEQDRLIGNNARNQLARNSANTISNIKRLIGRSFDDPTVQKNKKKWPFDVVSKDGKPVVQAMFQNENQLFSPEEISSMILDYMKKAAEKYLQESVSKCVITVPAYFNNGQRQATIDAAKIAGMDVLELLNEPTAAALAYGIDPHKYEEKENNHLILVFDFGGGTFDVSVLNINHGTFDVKATGGDSNLGGEDINSNMVDYLVDAIKRKKNIDISNHSRSLQRLLAACERVKRTLSSATQAMIDLPDFFENDDLTYTMTRECFEDINKQVFQTTIDIMESTLLDAKVDKFDIDEILLVGGSTRIPKIQQLVTNFFGKKPNMSVNPDEIVACGAATRAAVLTGDLDEGILGTPLIVREVTPLSLGVAVKGDVLSTIIERNTSIPVNKTQTYVTVYDDQTSMKFEVYQGERKQASRNSLLGSFVVDSLRPSRRGQSQVELNFEINTSGLLKAKAKNMDTQMKHELDIKTGNLSNVEIKEMIASAAKLKATDDAFMIKYAARKILEDYAYKVRDYAMDEFTGDSTTKQELIQVAMKIRDWVEDYPNAPINTFESKKKDLEQKVQQMIGKNI